MGCTSSAANIPESQTTTTDNMENNTACEESGEPINENDIVYSNTKKLEQRQVLPECEITKYNQIRIASDDNIKSIVDNNDAENKDVQDISPNENGHAAPVSESPPLNDNLPSLKLVVDKLIEKKAGEDEQISDVAETQDTDLDRQIEQIIMESDVSEDVEVEINEDEAKETPSPTQSEDSRATRWEALADIAAELPPSLAVDPLTGQIYSLTK